MSTRFSCHVKIKMRRYRYGDPKSTQGRNRVIGQVVKFFISWNIIGYFLWKYAKGRISAKDPEFKEKRLSEQIRYVVAGKQTSMIKYRVKIGGDKWINVKREDINTAAENNDTNSDNTESENLRPSDS